MRPSSADTAPISPRPRGLGDWGTVKTLLPYLSVYPWRVFLALACLIFAKVANIGIPVVLKHLIDDLALPADDPKRYLVFPLALVLAYGLLRLSAAIFTELREFVFSKVTQNAIRKVAIEVFDHLHALSLRFHLGRKTGGVSRDIDRGSRGIQTLISYSLFSIIPTLIEFVIVLIYLGWNYDWQFAGITLLALVVYITFTVRVTEWRSQYRRKMNDMDTSANQKAIDSLLNFETVKYFSNEQFESKRYDSFLQSYQKAAIKSQQSLAILNIGQQSIIVLGLIAILWKATLGVQQGQLSLGDIVLINTLMIQMYIDADLKEIILTDEASISPEVPVETSEKHSESDLASQAVALIAAGYRNLMLSGPPGTSKSYVVREIAEQLLGQIYENNDGPLPEANIVNLQFHPAYSYEDFVEGWRPIKPENGEHAIRGESLGGPVFDVVPGALLKSISDSNQVAQQQIWWDLRKESFNERELGRGHALWSASKAGGAQILPPVFIVLDEVNRANIPRVFGEVLQLIEVSKRSNVPKGPDFHKYCNTSIRLAVSGQELVIPENFIFISTMNTSDRSIARIDDAFRRRFTFIDCQPDPKRLQAVWAKAYSDYPKRELALSPDKIASGLRDLNATLSVSLVAGKLVGHTYFMPNAEEAVEGFTQEFLTRRWKHQVFPYLKSVDGLQADGVEEFARIEKWL
jgi:MoxR-like ATPase